MNDLDVARDLRAAANYLRVYGWIQDDYGNADGAKCIVGALIETASDMGIAAIRALGCATDFHEYYVNLIPSISHWNDTPGRTVEEVLERLEATATLLEIRQLAADKAGTPEPSLAGVA